MSGGYISCSGFRGSDKSGSAITGLLVSLTDFVPEAERATFHSGVVAPVLKGIHGGQDYTLIEADVAKRLALVLDLWYANQDQEFGHIDPWDAMLLDDDSGLDPVEAKWGKGKGWQFYCAHDLLQACRVSVETGEPICVAFD